MMHDGREAVRVPVDHGVFVVVDPPPLPNPLTLVALDAAGNEIVAVSQEW
mgnify:CR=1 FL=1